MKRLSKELYMYPSKEKVINTYGNYLDLRGIGLPSMLEDTLIRR